MDNCSADSPRPLTRLELLRDAAGGVALLVLLVAGAVGVGLVVEPRKPDWRHWLDETAEFARTGAIADNTAMYGYLPGFIVLLTPVVQSLSLPVFAALMAMADAACVIAVAGLLRRQWMGSEDTPPAPIDGVAAEGQCPPDDPPALDAWGRFNRRVWRERAVAPVLLCAVQIIDPMLAGQFSLLLLAGLVGGVSCVLRGRSIAGGLLIAAATTIKPPAGLLMLWCLWKGRPSAAAAFCAGMLVFAVLPAAIAFGPGRVVDEHLAWLRRADLHSHAVARNLPMHYRRNQALAALAGRFLRPLPSTPEHAVIRGTMPPWQAAELQAEVDAGTLSLTFAPVVTEGPEADEWEITRMRVSRLPRLSVADLSDGAVHAVWLGVTIALAAGLLWTTRGSLRGSMAPPVPPKAWHCPEATMSPQTEVGLADDLRHRAPAEAAVWILAIFWFTPYLYHNYFVWGLPAVAVLWAVAAEGRAATGRARWAAVVGLVVWVLAECLRGQWAGEFWGVNQWAGLVLAAAVLVAVPRTRAAGSAPVER